MGEHQNAIVDDGHSVVVSSVGETRHSQGPSVHAFDARSGSVLWQATGGRSFGATTVAGNLIFNGPDRGTVQIRRTDTGAFVDTLPTEIPCWCGVTVVGDAVIFGTGTSPRARLRASR